MAPDTRPSFILCHFKELELEGDELNWADCNGGGLLNILDALGIVNVIH